MNPVSDSTPVTHDDLIAKNRRTSIMMLAVEFLLVGVLGAAIGALLTQSAATGIAIGIVVAIVVDAIAWPVAVRATISLTHAIEVTPEQAPVLHNVDRGPVHRDRAAEAEGLHRRRSRPPTRSRSGGRPRRPASRSPPVSSI